MRVGWALSFLGLAGCAQLLGIEDVSLATRPDAAPVPDAPPPPPPRTLTVTLTGNGGGKITSSPPRLDCPGTCSAEFPQGTEVTLLQITDGGSSLKAWSGCTPSGGSCKVTLEADSAVSVDFGDNSDGYNFVFVTAEMYPVTMFSPLTSADALCNASARAAKLPGNYVAWLSTMSESARQRLGTTARGWVRVDGLPFTDRVQDLVAGKIFYPVRLDARGSATSPHEGVATGTDSLGQLFPNEGCDDWTSGSQAKSARAGDVDGTTWGFTEAFGHFTCADPAHLYCFGVDRNKALAPARTPGRIAFLSTAHMPYPLASIADADMLCQREAMNVGMTGKTFKALLSTVGASAASRMQAAGLPWVRMDGMQLTFEGESLLEATNLKTTINITAEGQYSPITRVATGSRTPTDPAFAGTTCDNWTSSSTTATMRIAHTHSGGQWWNAGFMPPCNETMFDLRVYCLEQ